MRGKNLRNNQMSFEVGTESAQCKIVTVRNEVHIKEGPAGNVYRVCCVCLARRFK